MLSPVLLVGGIASFLLLHDLDPSEQIRGSHPIGKLVRFNKRIQYKAKGNFSWKDAQVDQPLFKGDLIITGPDAVAMIETEDGQKIQLQPGTSVVLDDPKDLKKAMSGSVLIHGSDGEEHYLVGGADGTSATMTSYPVQMIGPEELSDVFVDANPSSAKKVQFTWKNGNSGSAIQVGFLQLAKNRFFETETIQEVAVPPGAAEIEVSVPEGTHFWRVVDGTRKPLSAHRQFNVRKIQALKPDYPAGSVTSWDDAVDFRWTAPVESPVLMGSHWIEISSTPEFNSLVQKKPIPALSLRSSVQPIPAGRYFWRLTSRYANLTLSSAPREIQVEKGRQLALLASSPKDRAVIYSGAEVSFQWESNSNQSHSILELSSADGSQSKKLEGSISTSSISDLRPGKYRWRIVGSLGNMHAETSWRELFVVRPGTLALARPKSGETVEVTSVGAPIVFEWDRPRAEKTATEYLLEVAGDPEFRNVSASKKSKLPKTTSADFNLSPDHDYFWRVTVLDQTGAPLLTSAASSFRYSIYQGLPAPQNLLPQSGVTCNPVKSGQECPFSWSSVPGASQYIVEFFKAGPQERMPASTTAAKPALRQFVAGTTFQTKSLEEGVYYWRVRALDPSNRPGAPTAFLPFRFTLGTVLSAPRGRSSEVQ